jgi:hypothetical protein
MYSHNNVTKKLPVQEDLNTTQGVMMVNDYFCCISDRCLEQTTYAMVGEVMGAGAGALEEAGMMDGITDGAVENPWTVSDWPVEYRPDPLMGSTGPWICGDGNPTFAIKVLQWDHPNYQQRNFRAFNGGFHSMLKAFGLSHLWGVWKAWYPTRAQLDWVMCPGDPNQVEDELVMSYLGIITVAACALLEAWSDSNESLDVSAIDVHEFMKATSEKCPIAMNIYNEIRYTEAVFLMHQPTQSGGSVWLLSKTAHSGGSSS